MQNGDLSTWTAPRIVVVLEGVLAQIPEPQNHRTGILRKVDHVEWPPAESWGWSTHAIKVLNHKAMTTNIQIDVVTFVAPEVGDMAAEWLLKYDIRNATCEYFDFTQFCTSLQWNQDIHNVIDSVPDRLDRYGIRAYETQWGGAF